MGHVSVASSEVFTAAEIARAAGVPVRAVRDLDSWWFDRRSPRRLRRLGCGGLGGTSPERIADSGRDAPAAAVRTCTQRRNTDWRPPCRVDGCAWCGISHARARGDAGCHEPGRFTAFGVQGCTHGLSRDPWTWRRWWRRRTSSAGPCTQGTDAGDQSPAKPRPGDARDQERHSETRTTKRSASSASRRAPRRATSACEEPGSRTACCRSRRKRSGGSGGSTRRPR